MLADASESDAGMNAPSARVAVIVNPISGTGGRADVALDRRVLAERMLAARRLDGVVHLTEYAGHARPLVRAALASGAALVIAWGGDGTVNEVASELVFSDVPLGIVPSGSGNGLARELQIPLRPDAAFAVALEGRARVIDAGEIDGRRFFNIAGLGLDARVAHEFAADGLRRRGFRRYLSIAIRDLFEYEPDEYTIVADGRVIRTRALTVALANGRQYGNGARIAPRARLDDGLLDLVVVDQRSPIAALLQSPMLFAGYVDRVPGVTTVTAKQIDITSGAASAGDGRADVPVRAHPVVCHVDGEPFVGGTSLQARVLPQALVVKVP